MPKYRQFRIVPSPGGGANIGAQESRVIEVPAGVPLPAHIEPVDDSTALTDWPETPTPNPTPGNEE